MKLNLGSGGEPREDYLNIDKNSCAPSVDLVYDLDLYPWPFASDIADEVLMSHCLEHLEDHNRAVKEIHRILKKGGIARITFPPFTWQFAFHDPTHRHFFGYNTFFTMPGTAGILISSFHHARPKSHSESVIPSGISSWSRSSTAFPMFTSRVPCGCFRHSRSMPN